LLINYENQRVEREQAEAQRIVLEEEGKRILEAQRLQEQSETEARNNNIIETRKQGVVNIIETLTGTERYVL
jgi:hypothetical protein